MIVSASGNCSSTRPQLVEDVEAVDAAEGPEVEDDDASAQVGERQRPAAGVEPATADELGRADLDARAQRAASPGRHESLRSASTGKVRAPLQRRRGVDVDAQHLLVKARGGENLPGGVDDLRVTAHLVARRACRRCCTGARRTGPRPRGPAPSSVQWATRLRGHAAGMTKTSAPPVEQRAGRARGSAGRSRWRGRRARCAGSDGHVDDDEVPPASMRRARPRRSRSGGSCGRSRRARRRARRRGWCSRGRGRRPRRRRPARRSNRRAAVTPASRAAAPALRDGPSTASARSSQRV